MPPKSKDKTSSSTRSLSPSASSALADCSKSLSSINALLKEMEPTCRKTEDETRAGQLQIDTSTAAIEAVSEATQLSMEITKYRKPHWNMDIWRKHFRNLDDPSIRIMMEWRMANPKAEAWPHAEVEDILGEDGSPTGKQRVTRLLSHAETVALESATAQAPIATSASQSETSSTEGRAGE